MRILVVCQYYYPEPSRLPDICEALVQQGHQDPARLSFHRCFFQIRYDLHHTQFFPIT